MANLRFTALSARLSAPRLSPVHVSSLLLRGNPATPRKAKIQTPALFPTHRSPQISLPRGKSLRVRRKVAGNWVNFQAGDFSLSIHFLTGDDNPLQLID
jgi:hypothetical protein